jgi:hypothetical protein
MGNIDTSALTGWASPGAVETAAEDIKDAGKAVQDSTADAKSTWAGLAGVYEAPERDIVLSAFDDVATAGDDVQTAAITVSDALNTFASEVRALVPAKNRLLDEVAEANAEPDGPLNSGPGTYTPNYAFQVSSLAGKYQAAEDKCSASIMGAHPSYVASTFLGGPGVIGSPLLGASSSVAQGIVGRVEHSRIQRPTLGGQPRLNAPIRMNQLPVDAVHQGTSYTRTPSGILAPSHSYAVASNPQPVATRYSHTTLDLDPSSTPTRPPAWAKWGGRGLAGVGAAVTMWDATSSRWRQDMVEHPDWGTSERVTSAATDAVVVGGASLAGAAAGAKAGAMVGTMIGGPVGLAVGVVVGAGLGALGGYIGKEFGEEIRGAFDGAADAMAEGVGDAVDKAGEVWDSLWG